MTCVDPIVWGLVPARAGSKGIPDKNLQQVQGHSLLGLAVVAARETPGIDRVFVSTDSTAYAEEGTRYGAEVPFLRPSEFAGDDTTDSEVFKHFLDWVGDAGEACPDIVVHLRPTTPARSPEVLETALRYAIHVKDRASSVRSVHPATESPFKWFLQDDAGYLTTFDGQRGIDAANRSRSEFPVVLIPNGYADFIYVQEFLSSGLLHGARGAPFVTEATLEVDDKFSLRLVQASQQVPEALIRAADRIVPTNPTEGLSEGD